MTATSLCDTPTGDGAASAAPELARPPRPSARGECQVSGLKGGGLESAALPVQSVGPLPTVVVAVVVADVPLITLQASPVTIEVGLVGAYRSPVVLRFVAA